MEEKLKKYEEEIKIKDEDEIITEMCGTMMIIGAIWNEFQGIESIDEILKVYDKLLFYTQKYGIILRETARRDSNAQEKS